MTVTLDNTLARRVFLDSHALLDPPAGPGKGGDLQDLIERLGFVQVDSVRTVERAHHMILFARRPAYRPGALARLLERDRTLFEHWTHDAAVIPARFFPWWQLKHARDAHDLRRRYRDWRRHGFEEQFDRILAHIDTHGPVSSAQVGEDEARGSGGWWDWHPSKTALEYLWRSGVLAVTRREGFRKIYDRVENVIPEHVRASEIDEARTVDELCAAALDRLGFATSGELAAFWDIVTPAEARDWVATAAAQGRIEPVRFACCDGRDRALWAWPGIAARADALPEPTKRMRVLSPFDPLLRDRARASRLFGFDYRIEIFTPAPKRRFGYYVFPLMEADRMVGRIDMKADNRDGVLRVTALWPEPGVRWGTGRQARLEAELTRVARFAGLEGVVFDGDILRPFPD